MPKIWKTGEVFVPGGMPSLTYVKRTEQDLEARLEKAKFNLCKLVTLTGATKSGKTVLANRIYPRAQAVWIDGGSVKSEDDVWSTVVAELEAATTIENTEGTEKSVAASLEASGETGIILAKGKVSGSGSLGAKKAAGSKRATQRSPRAAALIELRRSKTPLIIDDFHYISREQQGSLIRALKPLVFEGQPVICIAIPHRRYDAVKVEREMTGRLEPIEVPAWTIEELLEIPRTGFPLLNIEVTDAVARKLAEEAYGSPHLMQEFCRRLAEMHKVEERRALTLAINNAPEELFQRIAVEMGKVIFDKLKRGPRQRSDRLQRPLASGGSVDVYEAVLRGLARLHPGLQRVDYEQLRTALKAELSDKVPQAHEISRVLEKMSEIASSDEASTPVIDWDKSDRVLHITDPYFAFVLKWGLQEGTS
jgi:hypothetical protein